MDTKELLQMMHDKNFFDLKKMQYKYSSKAVSDLLDVLRAMATT